MMQDESVVASGKEQWFGHDVDHCQCAMSQVCTPWCIFGRGVVAHWLQCWVSLGYAPQATGGPRGTTPTGHFSGKMP